MRALLILALLATTASLGCGDDAGGVGGDASASASSTSTGSTGGQGGDGGAGAPLHPGPGEACDAIAQDCADPAASKCTLDFDDFARLPRTCEAALGDVGLGEPCVRPEGVVGLDDCAAGLFCHNGNEPFSDPQTRRCRLLCEADAQCPDGEGCALLNATPDGSPLPPDARLAGVCFDACDPLDVDACGEAGRCLPQRMIDLTYTMRCMPGQASVELGAACEQGGRCGPGAGCFGNVCRAFCDVGAGCEESDCLDITDSLGPLVFRDAAYGFCLEGAAN